MKDKKENPKPESATPPLPKPPVEKSTAEKDLDILKTETPLVTIIEDVFVDSKFEGRVEGEFENQEEVINNTTPFTEEERDAIFKEGNANIVPEEEVYEIPETQFKSPLDPNERKHYQMVLKSNKETISELRKKLTVALAENKSLSKKLEN